MSAGSRRQGGAARGQAATLPEVARAAALGVALQAALGAPFLAAAPGAYVGRAFELSRAFLHTWSVNLKFLPERVFLSPALAAGLLAAHLALLWLFAEHRRARACAQQPLPAPSAQRGRAGRGHGGRSLGGCLPPAHHCPRNGPAVMLRGPPPRVAWHHAAHGLAAVWAQSQARPRTVRQLGSARSAPAAPRRCSVLGPRAHAGRRCARARWCRAEGGLVGAARGALARSRDAAGVAAPRLRSTTAPVARAVNGAPARAPGGSPVKAPHQGATPGTSPGGARSGRAKAGSGGGGLGGGAPGALSAEQALLIVFAGNLIGVACARSLHFQFYAWCARA